MRQGVAWMALGHLRCQAISLDQYSLRESQILRLNPLFYNAVPRSRFTGRSAIARLPTRESNQRMRMGRVLHYENSRS